MFFSPVECMIVFRYLRSKRKEGFISVISAFSLLGVALGVAALIIVMSVMNGFDKELMGRILGFNGHIVVTRPGSGITDFDSVSANLKTHLPEITVLTPFIEGQVMATAKGHSVGALVRGIRAADLERKPILAGHIQGSLSSFRGTNVIIVGGALAQTLGVEVGGTITLISPETTITALGMVPRLKTYTVVGTFDAGMYQYDSSTVFMPLEAAQLFFRYPNQVSTLELMLKDPNEVSAVALRLYRTLGEGYRITDWQVANGHVFNALKTERSVMFLILTLIILVAAFNIISSLIMLVKDKGSAIAILRTMGASRGSIMRIFFLCGASIGTVGTLLGGILGVSFAVYIETIRTWLEAFTGNRLFDPVIYYLTQLPSDVRNGDVLQVILMALCLSFLATLYPAWKASTLNPAEALRYE